MIIDNFIVSGNYLSCVFIGHIHNTIHIHILGSIRNALLTVWCTLYQLLFICLLCVFVSGEWKWSKNCGSALVMLLPHGFDGQVLSVFQIILHLISYMNHVLFELFVLSFFSKGPEHSSARLERFLQLADDDPDEIPGKVY